MLIPNFIVNGTINDDLIALGYTDADGDVVTNLSDEILAGAGDDIVDAALGDDSVAGGLGNDTIYGRGGNDILLGGAGSDWISAGDGNDSVAGGKGNDWLHGGAGDDIVLGGRGHDFIAGGVGNDTLVGGRGNDILVGQAGSDLLITGPGTDTVFAGHDDDTIIVNMRYGGDHQLSGGTGSDSFVFVNTARARLSDVEIRDFELGVDHFSVEGVADALYMSLIGGGATTEADGGASTLLTLTTGDSITFTGISETMFDTYFGL